MNDFIAKYQDQLSGVLSGFDRLVFRGALWKDRLTGMKGYSWAHGLGAKDFGDHAEKISKRLKEASLAPLVSAGRPVCYLNSGKDDKQQIAWKIAALPSKLEGQPAVERPAHARHRRVPRLVADPITAA